MKTLKRVILVMGLILMIFTGCSKNEPDEATASQKETSKIKVGLSFDSYVIERWKTDRDIFVSTAMELGADVNVQIASGSVEEQINQIKYFINEKMDVIVIISSDSTSLGEVVKKAQNKGIKVIAYDRLIENANVDLYISFDNEQVGKLMAQTLIENVPEKGKILVVLGPTTDNNVLQIEKGFHEVIEKSELQIVRKDYAQGWLAENAFSAVNQVLETTDKIDGIVCGNDDLASQAIKALSEQRLAGDVCVIGQDADLNACQRIVEGTQTMTVYKPIKELAKRAAEYAVKLGKGEEISTSDILFDGTWDIPYEKLEPIAVKKDNMNVVIIDGGFHLKEDVYLNVP